MSASFVTENMQVIDQIIINSLREDIGKGDLTSRLLIPEGSQVDFRIITREAITICGNLIALRFFALQDLGIIVTSACADGMQVPAGTVLLEGRGCTKAVFAVERSMLNLLQHLCGIATQTRHYVDAVRGTNATILDTRKTMAGIRLLQKYAVRIGGGRNHRFCLDDGVLIKDNHIAVSGSITQAVALARAGITHFQKIEVECDTIAQVSEALGAGADIIMLDNMNMEEIKQAVKLVDGKVPLEVSGGVSLEKVKALASTGVEFISVGKLTHSVVASDIGLDIVLGL